MYYIVQHASALALVVLLSERCVVENSNANVCQLLRGDISIKSKRHIVPADSTIDASQILARSHTET
jgi:hypothetical protein